MSIAGINTTMYGTSYYNKVPRTSKQVETSFKTGACINLKMTDEATGDKALISVGFPDGRSVSVFKADNYSDENQQYAVRSWTKEGDNSEYIVDPTKIDARQASYYDMLAYSTYLDVTGKTKNAFGDFLSASRGINGDKEYDDASSNIKRDFKSLINVFMQAQYNAGNIAGYMSVKSFYDLI